jgi:hypothetical protein
LPKPNVSFPQVTNQLTWKDIPTFIDTTGVIVIAGKEACMVAFLHHHKCDWWLVFWL